MASYTTEAIILKRTNYGEADRMLTVLTPFRGKIRLVAKGVRRIASRRAGNVELLNKVRLHVFQGSGLGIITEAESMKTYQRIKSELTLSTYASHISELAERLLPEEQMNHGAYQLVCAILDQLELEPRQIYIRAFEVKLLTELGYWSRDQLAVDQQILELLEQLQYSSWPVISKMSINQAQAVELERVLRYYMEKILESPLKSAEVIKKIKEFNNG